MPSTTLCDRSPRALWRPRALAVLICGATASLAGCGETNELGRVPVSGTVTLDGQPLDRGSISFQPVDGPTSSGAGVENGQFTIPEERGLPPGTYLVRVYSAVEGDVVEGPPGDTPPPAKERIPPSWNTESDHKIEVKEGSEEVNTFTFDIKSTG